jgi:PAS domain S-box-containing protein
MSVHDKQEAISTEEALRQSEKRFRALIEHSSDLIALVNSEGLVTYLSPSITPIMGYDPEEFLGSHALVLVHPDDLACMQQVLGNILQSPGKTLRAEYRLRCKDGTFRWFEATATNLLHEPAVAAIVGNFHDITEQKRLEKQKDAFISMASHELKTPITSLKGFTYMLQRHLNKQRDEHALAYLNKMERQVDRLTKLIMDLLDISKIEMDQLDYREEEFDLDTLIQATVETIQAVTPKHRVVYERYIYIPVLGDKERIEQVLINLLTNAIKYSPRSDQVIVRVAKGPKQVTVSVQDFGMGVAKEYHQKIFERFYQVSNPEERPFSGLGIGLYLSNEIIKWHQGRMWVVSTKGEGATFYFSLPLTSEST